MPKVHNRYFWHEPDEQECVSPLQSPIRLAKPEVPFRWDWKDDWTVLTAREIRYEHLEDFPRWIPYAKLEKQKKYAEISNQIADYRKLLKLTCKTQKPFGQLELAAR